MKPTFCISFLRFIIYFYIPINSVLLRIASGISTWAVEQSANTIG